MVESIRTQRLALPYDAEDWWGNLPPGTYDLVLRWGGDVRFRIGEIQTTPSMFRYDPKIDKTSEPFLEEDVTGGAERFDRLLGKALTRAGWQLPAVDPAAFWSIVYLRQQTDARLEFIFDTNALVEGIGHWLATLFAERCDLVVTAVSLRELQDQHGGAKFGVPLRRWNEKSKPPSPTYEKDVLGRRQTYLAAMRFREFTGFERILWRELELEDASLLLSRGGLDKVDKKSSEADTTLLREVRRCIHDRVRGLERFFVTGDSALSRRAATELPAKSLICARVRELVRGRIYTPIVWWPAAADQGSALTGHTPMRLIWELLSVADDIELRSTTEPAQSWTFTSYDAEMWPSDYLVPWVEVTGPGTTIAFPKRSGSTADVSSGTLRQLPSPELSSPGAKDAGEVGAMSASTPPLTAIAPLETESRLFVQLDMPDVVHAIDANFRVGADRLMNVLAALVRGEDELPNESDKLTSEVERHLAQLLEALGLAKFSSNKLNPLTRFEQLSVAWRANDRETISSLLLPYRAYAEQVDSTIKVQHSRPLKTVRIARALASKLGQGMLLGDDWLHGGANPKLGDVRSAILAELDVQKVLTTYELFTNIFLQRLGVSPIRAMSAWDRMDAAGVFNGIEMRKGGDAPSAARQQSVATLSALGWKDDAVPLDKFRGIRDLVDMRRTHGG